MSNITTSEDPRLIRRKGRIRRLMRRKGRQ